MNDCISSNTDRSNRVIGFVQQYKAAYDEGADYSETVTDIVTDLLHFLADQGEAEPMATVLDSALMHFEAEYNEEPVT